MKKKLLLFVVAAIYSSLSYGQTMMDEMFSSCFKEGFVLLTQEYQMLDEDGEPVSNKQGKDYRGRQHICGIRVSGSSVLVPSSFINPWKKESAALKEKYQMIVSTCTIMDVTLIEPEIIECDLEDADEIVENHIYSFDISEKEGFEIDNYYGKKKGFAVWLCSSNKVTEESNPVDLKVVVSPMSITTKEGVTTYNLTAQPKGNVIGGAFITPNIDCTGTIKFKVNGVFEQFGGVWNMISLGDEENDESQYTVSAIDAVNDIAQKITVQFHDVWTDTFLK